PAQQQAAQARRDKIAGWVEERRDLVEAIDEFEARTLKQLRDHLAESLKERVMDDTFKSFHAEAGRCAARCHALREKERYLLEMMGYFEEEIADREKRVQSIRRVQQKWKRNPSGPLRGDKTKWLKTVPEMKKTSTGKRTSGARTMRRNIHDYNNYDHYYHMWHHHHGGFLPFDLFGWRAEERMPYDGFNRQLLPSVNRYREDHHEEKPDYAPFKEAESQAASGPDTSAAMGIAAGGAVLAAGAAVVAAEMMEAEAEAEEAVEAEITEEGFDEAAELLGGEDAALEEASEALAEEAMEADADADFGDSS
ncbi:MAG: hypothetical protein AAF492_01085, partial [Verrucomicrobiota bacterium]